jgi:Flp pilus assembly protein TadD
MDLTTEQTLQHGVAAHNQGNLQKAERLYRTILQVQPKHPDANHNLGLVATAMNQPEIALPLFKIAVEVDPNIEQFWLSYIEALIAGQQFDDAKRALKKGKKKGVSKEKLKALTKKLMSVKKGKLSASAPSEVELQKLINHYQTGRYSDAEKLAILLVQQFPNHSFTWKILGAIYKTLGHMTDALAAGSKAVELDPKDNQGHNALGVILEDLGRFEEAEASYRLAITLKYDYPEAHYNLGITLDQLGKSEEAETSYKKAIDLKPDYAKAHYNLGITLNQLGKSEEAETSYKKAIDLKPDYAEAHTHLGTTLQELGRLEDAEASYRAAIALKYDHAQAHSNLGIILYIRGDIDSSIESLKKAKYIDPNLESNKIILSILLAKKTQRKLGFTEGYANAIRSSDVSSEKLLAPFFASRAVEEELITSLYKMEHIELDKFDNRRVSDARYGNGKCLRDFNLFDDVSSIINSVAEDLTLIMREAVKTDIYVADSFFNILGAGGGTTPHAHISKLDADSKLNIAKQKYSLVYYLSVGDQNCAEPGVLKLYDPNEDILPCEGMIVIIPASRFHSAVYGGEKDRVMIGVNFYSL